MLIIIDQKHRVGKIALSAKKCRGMHRHRNWLLDGSGWLSVLLTHELNNPVMDGISLLQILEF